MIETGGTRFKIGFRELCADLFFLYLIGALLNLTNDFSNDFHFVFSQVNHRKMSIKLSKHWNYIIVYTQSAIFWNAFLNFCSILMVF